MLVPLGRRRDAPSDTADPLGLLLECHERIRRYGALAARLDDPTLSRAEVTELATTVRRYFEIAMPLHVLDEDRSLLPLLEARGADADLRKALAAMTEEHLDIEARITRLGLTWARLVGGDPAVELRGVAALQGAQLVAVLEPHLVLEETRIFPRLAALLTDADRVHLLDEIRARRKTG